MSVVQGTGVEDGYGYCSVKVESPGWGAGL